MAIGDEAGREKDSKMVVRIKGEKGVIEGEGLRMDPEVKKLLEDAEFNFGVLNFIPARYIEDALQEACLAALEGKSPTQAAKKYAAAEAQHECREVAMSQWA